mmetsp:Transcript_29598/g.71237  ORF Transcript_29598/g.71237 Transcript_29598/m.71237 type:complete len:80 (-) Transcript_29598:1108-1347(-)
MVPIPSLFGKIPMTFLGLWKHRNRWGSNTTISFKPGFVLGSGLVCRRNSSRACRESWDYDITQQVKKNEGQLSVTGSNI